MNNTENQDCGEETDELPGDGELAASETGEEQSTGEEASSPAEDSVEETAEKEPVKLSPRDELEKWRDIAARSQADLENYRKRMAREKSEAIQYANASLLSSLIPVIDNFEMGLKAAQNEGEESVIYQGMIMVQKQLQDFLADNRVEQIEAAEGQDFDPNQHEAIQQESSTEIAKGQILYTMRTGYLLKDRLLRPAMVVVSSGEESADSGDAGDDA